VLEHVLALGYDSIPHDSALNLWWPADSRYESAITVGKSGYYGGNGFAFENGFSRKTTVIASWLELKYPSGRRRMKIVKVQATHLFIANICTCL